MQMLSIFLYVDFNITNDELPASYLQTCRMKYMDAQVCYLLWIRNWSLARITGERVRVLENGVLKRLFVPKTGEATAG